jgi:hypothetical protein
MFKISFKVWSINFPKPLKLNNMAKSNPWLNLIKRYVKEIKKEGKLKGTDIVKEAIKRAKLVYKKVVPVKK